MHSSFSTTDYSAWKKGENLKATLKIALTKFNDYGIEPLPFPEVWLTFICRQALLVIVFLHKWSLSSLAPFRITSTSDDVHLFHILPLRKNLDSLPKTVLGLPGAASQQRTGARLAVKARL